MSFIVTTFDSEAALEGAFSAGTVETFDSEDALDTALDALTVEVVTKIITKGAKFTLVLDAALAANTIIDILAKGAKFTMIEETP
jgi:hypothetical protein